MHIIHHLSLAVLVVLTGCSRSSPPAQSTQVVSNKIDTAAAEPQPAAQQPAVEESVVSLTGKDVPMPYAANLEKLALVTVPEVIEAVKSVTYR